MYLRDRMYFIVPKFWITDTKGMNRLDPSVKLFRLDTWATGRVKGSVYW